MLPKSLKYGDTIAVFSPSSPATASVPQRYLRAKSFLVNKGFNFVEGNLTGKSNFYRSGTIKERAEEFNALIRNPEVKCIMSAIGGMNSNSPLPYIDYEVLVKNPKIIIGYSDVTAILIGIYAKTGLVTYYGPAVVASFGEYPPFVDETFEYFFKIVSGEEKPPYVMPTPLNWTDEFIDWKTQDRGKSPTSNSLVTINGGCVTGRLIGGNLNTMEGIWNTEYMPTIQQGDILFIEDSLKNPCIIERSFSLLKISGVFEKIGGLILGKHEKYDDMGTGKRPYEVLQEVIGEINFPFLAEFDCGHTHPMLTLPLGCRVELDATNQMVTLKEKFIDLPMI